MSIYRYEAAARGPRAFVALGLWWGALIAAALFLNAAWWVLLPLALASLPALYEMGKGAVARFELDNSEFRWSSGRRSARVARTDVLRVRLDTRLDFSLRMSLILQDGKRVRLPYECVPPAKSLEQALQTRDIPVERHHFTLFN